MYMFCKLLSGLFFKIFYRVKIEGEINIPDNKGFLICSNHIHAFDPALVVMATKRKISFMVKQELFNVPVLKTILKKSGAFPVDRSKGDMESIKTAIEILKTENVLSIFPEGTRHKDGVFRDIKKGAAMVAVRANSRIVPMRIIGNYRLFSKMIIRIGEPIEAAGLNKNELTEKLRIAIEELA